MRTYGKVFYKPAKKSFGVIGMFLCSGRIANSHTESSRKTMREYGGGGGSNCACVSGKTMFSNGILSLRFLKFTYSYLALPQTTKNQKHSYEQVWKKILTINLKKKHVANQRSQLC
jgi:hypothetical protein